MNMKKLVHPGLTPQLKNKLIQRSLDRRMSSAGSAVPVAGSDDLPAWTESNPQRIPDEFVRMENMPGYQRLRIITSGAEQHGLKNPYFMRHDGTAGAHTRIDGRDCINFASYNYLDFSGDERVRNAAKAAIDEFGTSVSGSRLVSGERAIHQELESAIARVYDADDAVTFVSGHAANVSTIGYLFGPRDLIIHDEFIHNSVVQGAQLSGAKRLTFAHNDWEALDLLLKQQRSHFERTVIIIEGLYSMDGDYPDLPRFIEVKNNHRAFLMVDEAHALGVMGRRGRGIAEHFNVPCTDVDIWMGTLSKALASCGGYIAGQTALIEQLRTFAPGFLYSVGMPASVAAAALESLKCLDAEPWRVRDLHERGAYFLERARAANINTGSSRGLAIVPAMIGSSINATRISASMLARGVNVRPILFPAVPEHSARLRFFLSCMHSEAEIDFTIDALAEELGHL